MPLVPNWFIKGLVVCRTVCGNMHLNTPCLGIIHNSSVLGSFPVCITGCGHIIYVSGGCNWSITGLHGGMNCLWFYATKDSLELFARALDCLPVPGLCLSSICIDSISDQMRRNAQ